MSNPTYPFSSPEEASRVPQSKDEVQRAFNQIFSQLRESPANQRTAIVRCGIYDRLSKVDPTSTQYSIGIQTEQALEFARARGWEVVTVYSDPDVTGRHSRRKGQQQAQHDAKAGLLDVLLIHRVDRSFRNLGSLIKFMNMMARYHVRVIFVAEQFDTESPGGRMMLYVLGAVAELYVRITSQRVREMKEARYAHGLPNGSHRLGYCNGLCSHCTDPNGPGYCPLAGGPDRGAGRVLVPHPIEQHAVRLIVHLYHEQRCQP